MNPNQNKGRYSITLTYPDNRQNQLPIRQIGTPNDIRMPYQKKIEIVEGETAFKFDEFHNGSSNNSEPKLN